LIFVIFVMRVIVVDLVIRGLEAIPRPVARDTCGGGRDADAASDRSVVQSDDFA
jgi:hypothetical protein